MQDLLHIILLPSSGKILKNPLFLEILRNLKRIFWFCIKIMAKKGGFSGIFFYCRISQDWVLPAASENAGLGPCLFEEKQKWRGHCRCPLIKIAKCQRKRCSTAPSGAHNNPNSVQRWVKQSLPQFRPHLPTGCKPSPPSCNDKSSLFSGTKTTPWLDERASICRHGGQRPCNTTAWLARCLSPLPIVKH